VAQFLSVRRLRTSPCNRADTVTSDHPKLDSVRDVRAIAFTSRVLPTSSLGQQPFFLRIGARHLHGDFHHRHRRAALGGRPPFRARRVCGRSGCLRSRRDYFRARHQPDSRSRSHHQSTGYCPEPSCWSVTSRVLVRLGISHPPNFTPAFEFRRCDQCGTTNKIKDDVFECIVCNSPLSHNWNYSNVAKSCAAANPAGGVVAIHAAKASKKTSNGFRARIRLQRDFGEPAASPYLPEPASSCAVRSTLFKIPLARLRFRGNVKGEAKSITITNRRITLWEWNSGSYRS
jgi:hypothetical protein